MMRPQNVEDATMAFGQKYNNQNVRYGLKESASDRRCPKCERKGALGRWMHQTDTLVDFRDCRYCGHSQVCLRPEFVTPA